jgi:ribosomal protein S27E
VVCHGCGEVLYEGRDMVPLYRLKAKYDGRCPACGKKLANNPQSITLKPVE